MRKLENFMLLEKLFKDGITPNWVKALANGYTELYQDNTMILNYYIENDICLINSGSIDDTKFCKSMLRDIKSLITSHNNVIISSSVASIERYLSKYGFTWISEQQIYSKGITWVS